ncbi:ubiquitin C-terminal hydrolase-like protein [Calycina marina]|uniref:Ubiquitin C-terminal hydrolase-like protein n=1 Tax=Calycina marina TaxID=1763456 RepID=A0A9P8CDX2_9HELO|nr:ubiquitin C-terminal hydrolase-like protein [Calycina marina]
MEYDPEVELPRERAASSEPCSTRPNPFDDDTASARKRQRRGSRSTSAETTIPITTPGSTSQHEESSESPPPTHTLTHNNQHLPAELSSSSVTINLRSTQASDAASPLQHSTVAPTGAHMVSQELEVGSNSQDMTRKSVESESDELSAIPAVVTPGSTPSYNAGSPTVELVPDDDDMDSDFEQGAPLIKIYDDDIMGELDPISEFPFTSDSETFAQSAKRMAQNLQWEPIEEDAIFEGLAAWIEKVLLYCDKHENKMIQSYEEHREFWRTVPEFVTALHLRTRYFGNSFSRERSRFGGQQLTRFLCAYASLAAKFVRLDGVTLSRNRSAGRIISAEDLVSRLFLLQIAKLTIRWDEPHIGVNLQKYYKWTWDDDREQILKTFLGDQDDASCLLKLATQLVNQLSKFPKVVNYLADPCFFIARLLEEVARLHSLSDRYPALTNDVFYRRSGEGLMFFKAASSGLEDVIEKRVTVLLPEVAAYLVTNLANVLQHASEVENEPVKDMVEKVNQNSIILKSSLAKTVATEWKLGLLQKLIMSTQMQLRVVGATTMCAELLKLHGDYSWNSPVCQYIADIISGGKVVEYLVGVGSHPEIINESHNIVGFLVATKKYPDCLAQTIWQAMTTSQDPRVVEAIQRLLKYLTGLSDAEACINLCKRIHTLPIGVFTIAMVDLCEVVLKKIQEKQLEGLGVPLTTTPLDLCMRLIRDSSVITADSPNGYPDVQVFANKWLSVLIKKGSNKDHRNRMYQDCIDDIKNGNPTAAGSMCVMHILLLQYSSDLHVLVTDHDFTRLMVQQLERSVSESFGPSYNQINPLQARQKILQSIIVHEPSTLTLELGAQLWDLLVGRGCRSPADRELSWQMLNSVVQQTTAADNQFLASCYQVHLQSLSPDCFTTGALEFARVPVNSWLRDRYAEVTANANTSGDVNIFANPALEQLWRMILTAPLQTIDALAIHALIEVYVDSTLIMSLPRCKARAIHSALVGRCLKQLATAANKLKSYNEDDNSNTKEYTKDYSMEDSIVIVASASEFREQEMIFARSLAVLREFLQAYQKKKYFVTPKRRSSLATASSAVEGRPISIKYQAFDGEKSTDIQNLTLNSTGSLFVTLQEATRFKNFRVFCGGRPVDPDEIDICKSFEELNLRGLVIVQRVEEGAGPTENISSSIDAEVMKHADELWDYLGMHEKVATEILHFLVKFPIHSQLVKAIEDESVHYTQIFPQGKPCKSLYAVHALREHVAAASQRGAIADAALDRSISLIVLAISDLGVLEASNPETYSRLCESMIGCLSYLLKEHPVPDSVLKVLNGRLLRRLLDLLYAAKAVYTSEAAHLTCRIYDAILEASSHSMEFWSEFREHLQGRNLLQELILTEPRFSIRKNIMKATLAKCLYSASLARVSSTDFAQACWPLVCTMLTDVERFPLNCEQIFHFSESLLKRLADVAIEFLDLDRLLWTWGLKLLARPSGQKAGRLDHIDLVVRGLSVLCNCAASFIKVSRQQISCKSLGYKLFEKHLFPDLTNSWDDGEDILGPVVPLIDSVTRHKISEAIFYLVKDDPNEYMHVLQGLHKLVPYDTSVDGSSPYLYDLGFGFERNRAIRSQAGYAGLRNLSNTCYLNSLLTQLFMNIPFRKFMMNAHLTDTSSQKLLDNTQKLFGYMQNSLERSVTPIDLTNSIRTYENTNIDVSIQMDVDEFYNLLFDRWEGQMVAHEDKQRFRTFYGGQLVQQVKSKECDHISERLEPFLAIQCDIKGKTSLQQSLQAYVDGEIMEGDNKYKCSTCDRHVDAVKRACLKDIPDSLIFHLKRFDFNLRTLQRSKLNDHFEFPRTIDMRPYTVDYLMDVPDTPEDEFELVGVLVHTGTAESGHYYSYIRERPSSDENSDPWAEFNDDTVSPWDPSSMEASCFGGSDIRGSLDTGGLYFDKTYSAYMLFYERKSSLMSQKQGLSEAAAQSPVHVPFDPNLATYIANQNELLMRKYCLHDPSHVAFANKMLSNLRHINKGQCSEDHKVEKEAITSSLDLLSQVVARTKDLPDFHSFMVTLNHICQCCAECSLDVLEWFGEKPDELRMLLMKNPETTVRCEISNCILLALSKYKAAQPDDYGFGQYEESFQAAGADPPSNVFQGFVDTLEKLWDQFHSSTRAWPEYFGLLSSIASMGEFEATILIEAGYLRRCLEIVTADSLLSLTPQYQRMLNNVAKRANATRPVSFDAVVVLLDQLLQVVDLSLDAISDDVERLDEDGTALKEAEARLIIQHWTRNNANILVQKLLLLPYSYGSTRNIIIMLLHHCANNDTAIFHAIREGIDAAGTHNGMHLKAAITYCEHTEEPEALKQMIAHVADAASNGDNLEPLLFVKFFAEIIELENTLSEISTNQLITWVVFYMPHWAPALLCNYESTTRDGTDRLIDDLLHRVEQQEFNAQQDDEAVREEDFIGSQEVRQKLAFACMDYLIQTYVSSRSQVVRATLKAILRVVDDAPQYFDPGSKELDTFLEKKNSMFPSHVDCLSPLTNTDVFYHLKKLIVEEAEEASGMSSMPKDISSVADGA